MNVEAVYAELTDDLTRGLRLPELVAAAADRYPDLVPGKAEMAAEAGRRQAEKQGLEIAQGVFCGAVLASPVCGTHLIRTMLEPTQPALDLLEAFRDKGRLDLRRVSIERRGEAAYVEFRNPDRLNAEDAVLVAEIDTVVDLVLLDDDVRVGVLRGAPAGPDSRRVFSAGIDLTDLRDGRIPYVDFLLGRELGYVSKILRGLANGVSKPWIGAVDRFAIGGGMQLLLVLDHVIADENAFFSLPAAEEGIVPGLGNLRLTRALGTRLARQVLLAGRRLHAGTPEGALVCDEVVADEDAVTAAVERAVPALAGPAVAANRHMLALAEEPLDLFRTYLAEFAVVQAERFYSEDVLAKVERRWQERRRRATC